MGNYLCIKSNRSNANKKREIHGPEACDSKSKSIPVLYPDGKTIHRNIFEHETAHEFLQSCFNEQMIYYEVMLELPLKGQRVLKHEDDFTEYWDDLVTIRIVLQGTGTNRDPDPSLLGDIQYKTPGTPP
ncbi:hypothetical protein BgiMline_031331 [Biomphalaria glabrata]|uniref:Uncharacterized protein LOC106073884 n=1 Tax=Biomphalaria glabrata TaxID=6526 RepID=A0A9U8EJR9_BIOGL|nr:uncharacterized protein LOC106073884 [Biomphalaria glabrata]